VILGTLLVVAINRPVESFAQSRDHVSLAQELIRAAVPDLSGNVSVTLNPNLSQEWRFAPLTTVTMRRFDPAAHDHSLVVLSISMQATNGVLRDASLFDEKLHNDRVLLFKSAKEKGGNIAAHVTAELRGRGAKHIPEGNDDFLTALNLDRFSGVIGPIQKARARFLAVPQVPVTSGLEFWPTWIVDVTTGDASVARCYALFIDPIDLRLTRISQTDCTPR